MAKKQKNYSSGKCEGCGSSIVLKPVNRKFCKSTCRYAYHNHKRSRTLFALALMWINENLLTVSQVAEGARMSEAQIRAKIKRNEFPVVRLYGRILLNKQDVQRLVSNSSQEVINAK
jgi:hypothetical protein